MSIDNLGHNPPPSIDTYTRFSQSSENIFDASVSEIAAKQRSISSASAEKARVAGPNFRGNVSYENFLELNGLSQSLGEGGLEGIAQRSKEAELEFQGGLEDLYAELEMRKAEVERAYQKGMEKLREGMEKTYNTLRESIAEEKREKARWEKELATAQGGYKDFVQRAVNRHKDSIASTEADLKKYQLHDAKLLQSM
ncbi:hypothetical protein [Pseudovibrio sp. Ad26]|uniref:hypothetical protein n=1 Tax=Pseudovibrio sp. Ad26 TaxID=989410 RepID=UPI0007AEAC9C|nr:hypothetical protein [Pseudovibrio sp. Ad26]KZL16493.1 hypothetical protein PsAD26_00533 [Pseudovibrio sp. Ad26]